MAFSHDIRLKKKHGQHFLRDESVVHAIINAVTLTPQDSVFEIGCGDGFLTQAILKTDIARLWVFEIDPEWATFVQKKLSSPRLQIFQEDILAADFSHFEPHKPWILLANLPYNITFPILYLIHRHRNLIKEGVIMVQEEVAEKLLKTGGRDYGFHSLFFQHYFTWKKLDKVPPTAFHPPPKVYSRLLHFTINPQPDVIENEDGFWHFVKVAFKQPRRTLRNNFMLSDFDITNIPANILSLRAQQMSKADLLKLWSSVSYLKNETHL